MKESQARALEEVAKKNRVTLETALNNAEKDKNRLLAVSTHTHTHRAMFSLFSRTERHTGLAWALYCKCSSVHL